MAARSRFPRIFGIQATRAPIVAVVRRGPSDWSQVGRWDVARDIYEAGSWIRAKVYPQRCDLSPDGRWLCYFALKGNARWDVGDTYVAISRLPWLTALAAWSTAGTWTRGLHFVEDREVWDAPGPDEGDAAPCRRQFGLALTRPAGFAVERRRGWTESSESPPRGANDLWDEARSDRVTLEKPRPGSKSATRLRVHGRFAAFRSGEPAPVVYEAVEEGDVIPLEDVQWADWGADGRLLVATLDGKLQIRDGERPAEPARHEIDLAAARPERTPPPAEARQW